MAGSRVLLFGSAPPLVPAAAALDARTINLVLVEGKQGGGGGGGGRRREREREYLDAKTAAEAEATL